MKKYLRFVTQNGRYIRNLPRYNWKHFLQTKQLATLVGITPVDLHFFSPHLNQVENPNWMTSTLSPPLSRLILTEIQNRISNINAPLTLLEYLLLAVCWRLVLFNNPVGNLKHRLPHWATSHQHAL